MEPTPSRSVLREQLAAPSRYELLARIASGGMATVYVGRLSGAVGFRRLVAIKRAHPHLIEEPRFRQMLVREARLASAIHHPNVVSVQDVEELEGELLLVMDYIEGASLAELLVFSAEGRATRRLPPALLARIALDACAGLHAAHEQADEDGQAMHLVHRDISPHNVLLGVDGMARIADFGIAKAAGHGSVRTVTGELKGKVAYMAPEYVSGKDIDARADVFALGVVIWEAFAHERLFRGAIELETMQKIVAEPAPLLSAVAPSVGATFNQVLAKALAKSPDERWPTARAFGNAFEEVARSADLLGSHADVAEHVDALIGKKLAARREAIRLRAKAADETAALARTGSGARDGAGVKTKTKTPTKTPTRTRTHPASAEAHPAESPRPDPVKTSLAAAAQGDTSPVLTSPITDSAVRAPLGRRRFARVTSVVALCAAGGLALAALVRARANAIPKPSRAEHLEVPTALVGVDSPLPPAAPPSESSMHGDGSRPSTALDDEPPAFGGPTPTPPTPPSTASPLSSSEPASARDARLQREGAKPAPRPPSAPPPPSRSAPPSVETAQPTATPLRTAPPNPYSD